MPGTGTSGGDDGLVEARSTLPGSGTDNELRESMASVAEATDPTTGDPFVDLDLVDSGRWVAPGGWPRAIVGVGVGLAAGLLVVGADRADRAAAARRSGGPTGEGS